MQENPKRLLRVTEAAEYIGVHPQTIRNWAMNGTLPERILPGSQQERRFIVEDLDALIESTRRPRKVQRAI